MNIYSELEEVGDMQNDIKNISDVVLDNYKKYPKECGHLLNELNSINKDLNDLEKEFELLLKEI